MSPNIYINDVKPYLFWVTTKVQTFNLRHRPIQPPYGFGAMVWLCSPSCLYISRPVLVPFKKAKIIFAIVISWNLKNVHITFLISVLELSLLATISYQIKFPNQNFFQWRKFYEISGCYIIHSLDKVLTNKVYFLNLHLACSPN